MKIFTALLLLILIPSTLPAQMNGESRLMEIETTVLDYLAKTDPSHLQNLLSYFKESDESTIDERTAQLENVKTELAAFLGDVGIEGSPNGLKFYFSNDDHEKILFVAITNNGFIESLRIEDSTPSIALTVELLPKLVDSLSQNGYSGLLCSQRRGDVSRPTFWNGESGFEYSQYKRDYFCNRFTSYRLHNSFYIIISPTR